MEPGIDEPTFTDNKIRQLHEMVYGEQLTRDELATLCAWLKTPRGPTAEDTSKSFHLDSAASSATNRREALVGKLDRMLLAADLAPQQPAIYKGTHDFVPPTPECEEDSDGHCANPLHNHGPGREHS